MLADARSKYGCAHVGRTIVCREGSRDDTLAGFLGEYAYCQYAFGNWRLAHPEANKGKIDCHAVEVKASAFPYRPTLNLYVREDYALKRKPYAYVQVIINLPYREAEIAAGQQAIICGWATAEEVDAAPKKDPGGKKGAPAGYQVHHIPLYRLHPIEELDPLCL